MTLVTDSTALVFSDQEWLFFSKAVNVTWDENEPYRQEYAFPLCSPTYIKNTETERFSSCQLRSVQLYKAQHSRHDL